MTRIALGGYRWVAILKDGRTVEQFPSEGIEQSVDVLKDQDVQYLHLVPLQRITPEGEVQPPIHRHICLQVSENEGWLKYWTRTFALNVDSGEQVEVACVDTVALAVSGGTIVYLHTYPDGSSKLTTQKEP